MQTLNAQLNIISYAVLATTYASDKKITSAFSPLVEYVLATITETCVKATDIRIAFEQHYGYEMHSAILDQILRTLLKERKIEKLKNEYIQINKNKLEAYDFDDKYKIKLRALVSEFELFLNKKQLHIEHNKIGQYIFDFLYQNSLEVNAFIQHKSNLNTIPFDSEIDKELVNFLLEERRNDTKSYKFILDIYSGIILSSVMITGDEDSYSEQKDCHIENVLLDSNYLFRLLDLQTEIEHQAAVETHKLLKEHDCKFWVCAETLKQIADTVHNIIDKYSESAHSILKIYEERFSGVASACFRRNLSPAKLEEIVDTMEDFLRDNYDVFRIDDIKSSIDFITQDDNDYTDLLSRKPDASDFGIKHDLLLIHIVREKRPSALYKPRDAKWWVLTDDNKLTKWNMEKANHAPSECMTEAQLATIMWLASPQSTSMDGLFNTVIALKSRELLDGHAYEKISHEIEYQKERFSENPKQLKKLALIFSQKQIPINSLLDNEQESINALFDKELEKVHDVVSENEQLTSENERLLQQNNNQNKLLDDSHNKEIWLIEKNIALINATRSAIDKKTTECDEIDQEISVLKERYLKRVKCCSLFIAGVILLLVIRPIDKLFGGFYDKHQLVCNLGKAFVALAMGIIGYKTEKIEILFENFFNLLIKWNVLSKYKKKLNSLNQHKKELYAEISELQTLIEETIATPTN